MSNAQELVNSTSKLITLPEVYFQAKKLIDDTNSSNQAIGNVIAQDPALTVQLLKIVNSPFFGLGTKIDTVPKAITMLGLDQLHSLLLATSVADAFSGMPSDVVDMHSFWWNSNYSGVVSRLLADHCNIVDGDQLFVAGLLSDIGHLIMYQQIPGKTQQVMLEAKNTGISIYKLERSILGFDYAQIGKALCKSWCLPDFLLEVVGGHADLGKSSKYPLEAAIVHIARKLAQAVKIDDKKAALKGVSQQAWELTGVSIDAVEEISKQAQPIVDSTFKLFAPNR